MIDKIRLLILYIIFMIYNIIRRASPIKTIKSHDHYIIVQNNGMCVISYVKDCSKILKEMKKDGQLTRNDIVSISNCMDEINNLCKYFIDKDKKVLRGFRPSWIKSWKYGEEIVVFTNNLDEQLVLVKGPLDELIKIN